MSSVAALAVVGDVVVPLVLLFLLTPVLAVVEVVVRTSGFLVVLLTTLVEILVVASIY